MIHSTQTLHLEKRYGLIKAVEMLVEGGWKNLDVTCEYDRDFYYNDEYKSLAERLKEYASKNGVSFIQGHAPFGRYDWDLNKMKEEYLWRFPRMFEFLGALGVKNVVVHPIHNLRHYGNEEALFETNMEFYTSLVPYAKSSGVNIAIENMWHYHPVARYICDSVCSAPEELARYYDTLKHHGVFTVCLDLGHVALTGREPERVIRQLGERIGCLHVHDVDYKTDLHTLPGASKLNWEEITRALGEIDYKGSFNLEADYFFRGFPEELENDVIKFMEKTARTLATKVDAYRK